MNHVYRIVFNRALGVMQVASELASHRGGGRGSSPRRRPQLPTLLALALMLAAGGAGAQVAPGALPTGPNVVTGIGGITSDGTTMTVTQDQARALIRWDTFNIGADTAVVFEQTAGQMALNQILDTSASQIMGELTAGGTIFLINPYGVVFGAGARVDVGALVASTLVPDDDMKFVERTDGEYVHDSLTWAQTGTAGLVSNAGTINAANGAVLLGAGVRNEAGGTIDVGTGRAALLAGGTAQLALEPGRAPRVLITPNASAIPAGASSGVSNAGAISAQGGTIELTGLLAAGLAATAVNNTGVLSAGGIAVGDDGSISLLASGGDLHAGGTIDAGGGRVVLDSRGDIALSAALTSGRFDVLAHNLTQTGGNVRASGRSSVAVTGDAILDSAGNDFDVLALDARGRASVVDADSLSVETGQDGAVDGDLTVRSTGELQLAGTVHGSLSATSNGGPIYTGPLRVGGALSLISGGGDITEIADGTAATLWVAGASTLDAGSGMIQLFKNHDFRGRVDVTGRTVGLRDINSLELGTLDVSSDMIVLANSALALGQGTVGGLLTAYSSAGGITQAGALSIGGLADINAGVGNITLAHADNDFSSTVRLIGNTATVRDANALTLGVLELTNLTATSTGALSLGRGLVRDALSATSTGGAITQSGALTVSGTARIDAAGAITLDNAGNNFAGTLHLDGAAVRVSDAYALRLGTTVADSLTVNSGGALTLGTTQVGGTLAATSAGGGITQAGALSVGGASTVNAGAGAITLDNAGNDFAGTLRLVAADARVHDSNVLQLTSVDVRSLHASSGGRMVLGGRVGGQLIATSATGGIGQDAVAPSGALTVQGPASLDAGAGAITLGNVNNDFSGPVDLAGGAVNIRDTNTLGLGQLDVASLDVHSRDALSLGQGTIRGALAARNAGGGITQTGALRVEGVANVNAGYGVGAGAITLDHVDNDFRGAVTLVGGAARVRDTDGLRLQQFSVTSLDATSGGALSLGGGDVRGDFTATSTAGGITQQGAITVNGTSSIDAGTGNILLTDAGNRFTGTVNLWGGAVAIAGGAALDLGAVDATSLLAAATRIGLVGDVTTSGGQTYDGALVLREDVALNAGGAVDFLSTVDGAHRLSVDAGGVVAFDAAVGGGTALAGLYVDALGFGAASTVDVGDLSIAVQAGGITQQDAFHVAGNASFDAGAGNVFLTHADNDFAGPVALRGDSVQVRDRSALTLGALDVGELAANSTGALGLGSGSIAGVLVARSGGGAISQAGALSVGGVSTIDAGAGAITLDNAGNDFASLVRLEGGAAVVRDANALHLDTLDVAGLTATSGGTLSLGSGNIRGDLVASSAGDITQQGALIVTGTGDIDAGSGRIQLGHANNDFQSTLHLAGASATLADANALSLGVLDLGGFDVRVTDTLDLGRGSVAGNLIAMSRMGGIRQSGALSVAGTSTITATGNIELTNAGNDFVGAVSIQSQGATVSLRDANALHLAHGYSIQDFNVSTGGALNLGSMWVGRSFVALSGTGGITQTGELWAGGTSSIDAGTGDITLTNAGNDFNGTVNLAGGNVTVRASDALALGTLAVDALTARSQGALGLGQGVVGGDLSASSQGGAIIQAGALSVGGASSIDAGTGDITLTQAGNDFVGAVDLTGGAVAIADANALVLGQVAATSLHARATTIGLANDVATGGDQDYDGALVLGADAALVAGGDVRFGATVDGAHRLSVHADGAVVFDAAVGGATALAGLDVDASSFDAASGIGVDGGLSVAVRTGDIAQSGAWRVGGNADFDAGAGAITLSNAGNDFGGAVHLSGGAAVVRDANALQLGTLDVAGLTATSGGALSLGSGQVGGNLVATSQGGGITQAGALSVAGTSSIDAGAGNITLTNAGNDFAGPVGLSGGAIALRDRNDLTLSHLRSAPGGDVHVVAGGALALPAQAIDAGSGSLHLAAHGGTLTSRGTLAGSDVSLHGAGGVVLAGDVLADGRLHLESGGDLVQSGGRVAAALLTGRAAGEARLAGANRIAELGAFSASRIHLANAGPLAVTGPVDARAGSLLLALSEGDLAIDGHVSAADIRLEVAGGIAQGADGQLVARTLSGRAGGAVNLGDGQRFIDNQIERIGDFTARAGFSMTNGRSLTLSSLNGSDFTIDAGEAEFYVSVDGDLRQDGTDWLYNGRGTWVASGGIGLQEAPIHVMGVESQVATPGVPPAYFNAVRRDGSLLPIVGDAVNVPTALWAGRAQTSSNRQVAYVDVGADASNYRGYGLVEPGVRLPEDQQPECDPDFPGPDCADTAMTTLHDAFWQAAHD
jgi:filamentous hemagglutinin family protein